MFFLFQLLKFLISGSKFLVFPLQVINVVPEPFVLSLQSPNFCPVVPLARVNQSAILATRHLDY